MHLFLIRTNNPNFTSHLCQITRAGVACKHQKKVLNELDFVRVCFRFLWRSFFAKTQIKKHRWLEIELRRNVPKVIINLTIRNRLSVNESSFIELVARELPYRGFHSVLYVKHEVWNSTFQEPFKQTPTILCFCPDFTQHSRRKLHLVPHQNYLFRFMNERN